MNTRHFNTNVFNNIIQFRQITVSDLLLYQFIILTATCNISKKVFQFMSEV